MVLTDDEPSLIRASQKGDHEAFETLIKRYQQMIHALTFRMTGGFGDSEDLAQETFIAAYQQLEKFRGESKFSSWLYQIAVNRCLNWQKQSRRRQELLHEWQPESSSEPQNDALGKNIQEALMKLHPKQRAAIVLTTYDGLSHAEAAKALGCSETTVSWRIFAARGKLKRFLKDLKQETAR
jgi:RNA polymerase sigma-70 factor (ECF subfamily)